MPTAQAHQFPLHPSTRSETRGAGTTRSTLLLVSFRGRGRQRLNMALRGGVTGRPSTCADRSPHGDPVTQRWPEIFYKGNNKWPHASTLSTDGINAELLEEMLVAIQVHYHNLCTDRSLCGDVPGAATRGQPLHAGWSRDGSLSPGTRAGVQTGSGRGLQRTWHGWPRRAGLDWDERPG